MALQSINFNADASGMGEAQLIEMVHHLVPGSHALSDEEILRDFLAVEFIPNDRPLVPLEEYHLV
jgi:hypothetical protein